MKKPISFESIGFEVVSSMDDTTAAVPEPDEPFRICVLGDFSGRSSRGVRDSLLTRNPIPVDRDNFDEVLLKLKPRIAFEVMGQPVDACFESLDDFHPDALWKSIGLFRALQDTRKKIDDPRTFNAALKELRILAGEDPEATAPQPEAVGKTSPQGGSLLDEIVESTDPAGARKTGASGKMDLAEFVDAVVKPYSVAAHDPAQDRLKEALDEYTSLLMAEVLHHRTFQETEAAWRGLHFLVSRAETDEYLRIYLLDVSLDELAGDLLGADDIASSGAFRLLCGNPDVSAGGKRWAVLAGMYTFDYEDAAVLGRMAGVAAWAGAPFIAGAHPHLIGCRSLEGTPDPSAWKYTPGEETAQVWDDLRHLPEAAFIGLAVPKFLLRLPYGRDTDETESFSFEEMPDGPVHGHYLRGSPAIACALLLAEAFSRRGWDMAPGEVTDIDGLPLHSVEQDGEPVLVPCTEALLSDKAVEAILDRGIMPLACLKNTDAARLVRFQSLADPAARLRGRWV